MMYLLLLMLMWLALHNAVREQNCARHSCPEYELRGDLDELVERRDNWSLVLNSDDPAERISQGHGSKNITTSLLQGDQESAAYRALKAAKPHQPVKWTPAQLMMGTLDSETFAEAQWDKLGSGAFAEVWLAALPSEPRSRSAQQLRQNGVTRVAIKFFYCRQDSPKKIYSYAEAPICCGHDCADRNQCKQGGKDCTNVKEKMLAEKKTCEDQKRLTKAARQNHHPAAAHMCQCFWSRIERHFPGAEKTAYVVQEYCGQTLLHYIHEVHRGSYADRVRSRKVTYQLLTVLDFLLTFDPKGFWVHHDLKTENIVYTLPDREPDDILIKVIDFGELVQIPRRGAKREVCETAMTEWYIPPEVKIGCPAGTTDFQCPHSFDIYAAGLIHTEMLLFGWHGWIRYKNLIWLETMPEIEKHLIQAARRQRLYFDNADMKLVKALSDFAPCRRPCRLPLRQVEHSNSNGFNSQSWIIKFAPECNEEAFNTFCEKAVCREPKLVKYGVPTCGLKASRQELVELINLKPGCEILPDPQPDYYVGWLDFDGEAYLTGHDSDDTSGQLGWIVKFSGTCEDQDLIIFCQNNRCTKPQAWPSSTDGVALTGVACTPEKMEGFVKSSQSSGGGCKIESAETNDYVRERVRAGDFESGNSSAEADAQRFEPVPSASNGRVAGKDVSSADMRETASLGEGDKWEIDAVLGKLLLEADGIDGQNSSVLRSAEEEGGEQSVRQNTVMAKANYADVDIDDVLAEILDGNQVPTGSSNKGDGEQSVRQNMVPDADIAHLLGESPDEEQVATRSRPTTKELDEDLESDDPIQMLKALEETHFGPVKVAA